MYLIPDTSAGWGASPRDGAPTFNLQNGVAICVRPTEAGGIEVRTGGLPRLKELPDGALLGGLVSTRVELPFDPGQLSRVVEDGQELPVLALVSRAIVAAFTQRFDGRGYASIYPASAGLLLPDCPHAWRAAGGPDLTQLLRELEADPTTLAEFAERIGGSAAAEWAEILRDRLASAIRTGAAQYPGEIRFLGQIQEELLQPDLEDAVRAAARHARAYARLVFPGDDAGAPLRALPAWPIWLAGTAGWADKQRRSLYRSIIASRGSSLTWSWSNPRPDPVHLTQLPQAALCRVAIMNAPGLRYQGAVISPRMAESEVTTTQVVTAPAPPAVHRDGQFLRIVAGDWCRSVRLMRQAHVRTVEDGCSVTVMQTAQLQPGMKLFVGGTKVTIHKVADLPHGADVAISPEKVPGHFSVAAADPAAVTRGLTRIDRITLATLPVVIDDDLDLAREIGRVGWVVPPTRWTPVRPNRRGLSELQGFLRQAYAVEVDGDAVTVDGQAATLVTRPLVLTGLTVERERQTHRGYIRTRPVRGATNELDLVPLDQASEEGTLLAGGWLVIPSNLPFTWRVQRESDLATPARRRLQHLVIPPGIAKLLIGDARTPAGDRIVSRLFSRLNDLIQRLQQPFGLPRELYPGKTVDFPMSNSPAMRTRALEVLQDLRDLVTQKAGSLLYPNRFGYRVLLQGHEDIPIGEVHVADAQGLPAWVSAWRSPSTPFKGGPHLRVVEDREVPYGQWWLNTTMAAHFLRGDKDGDQVTYVPEVGPAGRTPADILRLLENVQLTSEEQAYVGTAPLGDPWSYQPLDWKDDVLPEQPAAHVAVAGAVYIKAATARAVAAAYQWSHVWDLPEVNRIDVAILFDLLTESAVSKAKDLRTACTAEVRLTTILAKINNPGEDGVSWVVKHRQELLEFFRPLSDAPSGYLQRMEAVRALSGLEVLLRLGATLTHAELQDLQESPLLESFRLKRGNVDPALLAHTYGALHRGYVLGLDASRTAIARAVRVAAAQLDLPL